MIKELVNFTKSLDPSFISQAVRPREGLYILLEILMDKDDVQHVSLKEYEIYSKKLKEESESISNFKFKLKHGWCIDTNKCFDLPTKAIHSCSPFLVAFKKEHLPSQAKYIENTAKGKKQITERFSTYFEKGFDLLSEEEKFKYSIFANYFIGQEFLTTISNIENSLASEFEEISSQTNTLKGNLTSANKDEKEDIKIAIKKLEEKSIKVKNIEEADYYFFMLDLPIELYKETHNKYLSDKLFNTGEYNIKDDKGEIFGTSNFKNSPDSGGKKPFQMHQTAPFQINGRISSTEANYLYEFENVMAGKVLPNPLPLFTFKEELQRDYIRLFKESGNNAGFREIVEKLPTSYLDDLGNYYLINWVNSTDGIIFRDYDFVSIFDYGLKIEIPDLFGEKYFPLIKNVFEFQEEILPIIFNNNLVVKTKNSSIILKYFDDIEQKYCKSSANYLSILKYRKAWYDFIYKSNKSSITLTMIDDMMKVSIMEDIRLDQFKNGNHSEYFNIRKKLNIWFSLINHFDSNSNHKQNNMASKLIYYKAILDDLLQEKADIKKISNEEFMFITGQVIDYLLSKSRAADQSYKLLEPYTQKTNCKELKKAIANDFARYKHENYSRNFENAAAFVLSYETEVNLRDYLPELLCGLFSKNQLYSTTKPDS